MKNRLVMIALLATLPANAQEGAPPFAAFDLASEPVLMDPHDLAFGPDGRLYVADKFGSRLAVLDPNTLEVLSFIGEGSLPGIHDISFDGLGKVALAVTGAGAVAVYADVGAAGTQPDLILPAPRTEGALAHSNGRIYAVAGGVGAVVAFEGDQITASVQGHLGAHDIAEAKDGSIWIADNASQRLVRYSEDLQQLQVIDHPKFGFIGPRYMDVDDFGRLVVADQDAHRILLIDPAGPDGGTLIGVLGDGMPGMGANKFDDPEGVAVRGSRYYVSDSDNNRIVRYSVVIN